MHWDLVVFLSGSSLARLAARRAGTALRAAAAETSKDGTWDPEGLFKGAPAGGHFARRDRERGLPTAADTPVAQQQTWARPIVALPPEPLAGGGPAYDKAALQATLADAFLPVRPAPAAARPGSQPLPSASHSTPCTDVAA